MMKPQHEIHKIYDSLPKEIRDTHYQRWLKKSKPLIKRFINENINISHNKSISFQGLEIVQTVVDFKNLNDRFFKFERTVPEHYINRNFNTSSSNATYGNIIYNGYWNNLSSLTY